MNRANQYHDERMIYTLGPLAWLINNALVSGTKSCSVKEELAHLADNDGFITVFKGVGLPESAIKDYEKRLKQGKDQKEFYFTGFTSTSINK